jgi:hypothetical protein
VLLLSKIVIFKPILEKGIQNHRLILLVEGYDLLLLRASLTLLTFADEFRRYFSITSDALNLVTPSRIARRRLS